MNEDFGFLAQVLARYINRYFVQVGNEMQISGNEVVILNFFFDKHQAQVHQKDIEVAFNIRSATVTSNIHLMTDKGLLKKLKDPNDKRGNILVLTAKANTYAKPLADSKTKLETLLTAGMSADDQVQFRRLLKMAVHSLSVEE